MAHSNKKQQGNSVKTNNFWLGYISGQLEDKESLDQFKAYGPAMGTITPAELKQAANSYLSGKNYIRLVLLPDTVKP